jgi:hypothetical protein
MNWKKVLALVGVVVTLVGFGAYRFVVGGGYERWKLGRTVADDVRYKDYVERGEELNAIVSKVQNWEVNLVDKSVHGGDFNMKQKNEVAAKGVYKDTSSIKDAPKDLKVDVTYFYDISNNRALQHIRVNSEEKKIHKNTTVIYDKDGTELITYE